MRIVLGLALMAALCAGCSDDAEPEVAPPRVDQSSVVAAAAKAETLPIPGGDALVLRALDPNGRLVIYVHGAGEDQTAIRTDPQKAPIVTALLDEGYDVAAADAFGDAWGSDASLDAYVELQDELAPRRGTYMLVQSMGGLVGLRAPDVLRDVRAVAAIFPVCDLGSMVDGPLGDLVQDAWGAGLDAAVDELGLTVAEDVDGLPMQFWASPDDRMVPFTDNTEQCAAAAEERGANVELTKTQGTHGDNSNFDAAAVVALFDAS